MKYLGLLQLVQTSLLMSIHVYMFMFMYIQWTTVVFFKLFINEQKKQNKEKNENVMSIYIQQEHISVISTNYLNKEGEVSPT